MPLDSFSSPFLIRRKFFIHPSFQGKLVLAILGAALFSAVLLVVDYYYFFGRNVPGGPWDRDMMWIFLKANRPLIIQLVVFVIVLCVVLVFLSHRVVGPIYSLEKSIRIVREGNLVHRARFRKNDELTSLRDAFNGMLDAIHAKVLKDRDAVAAARREIEPLLGKSHLDADTRAKLELIKGRLETITRGFTL